MKLNINKQKATAAAKAQPRPTPKTQHPPEADAATLEPWILAVEAAGGLSDDYDTWLRAALALAAVGERGRDWFHRISRFSSRYNAEESDAKFDEALKNGNGSIGPGTFVHLCKKAGIKSLNQGGRAAANALPKKIREALDAAGVPATDAELVTGITAALHAKNGNRTDGGLSVMLHEDVPARAAEIIAAEVKASPAVLSTARRPTRDDIRDQLGALWTIYFDPSNGTYYRGKPGEKDPAKWQKFDKRSSIVNDFLFDLQRVGLNIEVV